MADLLDCPPEILCSILECLPAHHLRSICLANKGLRKIAEPLLYARIELVWNEARTPPIIPFIRSLQRRPSLANQVQHLTLNARWRSHLYGRVMIEDPDGFSFHQLPPSISVDGSELASLVTTIQDINPPFRDLWIQELGNGVMDAFVILLLSLIPNLTHLRLIGVFARETRLLGMLLRASLCQTSHCELPRFQYLQEVDFDPELNPFRDWQTKNTADVLPLLYLPSVQSIKFEVDNPFTFSWPTHRPSPSNITALDLQILREGLLGCILAVTENLKTLRWEWVYEPDLKSEFNNHVINLDQIITDLSLVQDTLENLHLLANVGPEVPDYPVLEIKGSLRGLKNFEKIQTFEAPQVFLVGFSPNNNLGCLEDLLPKNIYHLTINDDLSWLEEVVWEDRDLFAMLQRWWENLTPYTPHFHSFELSLLCEDRGWCAEIRNELSELCARLGIRLDIFKRNKDFVYTS
ncbi:uncharacterized protein TrAtP1_000227 [Trichoderma atroviride]|uniref:Uncharacterized protein n=1 Tax=Hypocrea atroviridis (strain ATCC 20476 / IMI 206040) TaxID=452589 RepID=G9NJU9_HYPAI|nr:uncharacterized protein TRIATDRAFT_315510 [Trichoderma atroviride IMI 206040]EHK49171.1 hypothetical protein TRIATDRAFT_315510 [Trichoderma atroviride IMI 206040]UKZ58906.1 hypothetical protein TrAtP1_000227 [Trichoderma atroviride]